VKMQQKSPHLPVQLRLMRAILKVVRSITLLVCP
jgi:hypothetical protein